MAGTVATVALCAAAVPSSAQEEPRWFTDVGDVGAFARWGIPETDAVGFTIECEADGGVEMRPALYAMEEPSTVPNVTFNIDGQAYVRDARLVFSEADAAWQAAVNVSGDDALINALRRGARLTYDFDPPLREGDRFTLSLSGSARAIDAALVNCR